MRQRGNVQWSPFLRCVLGVSLWFGCVGCRSTTTFVGAIVCQGVPRLAGAEAAGEWAFRGLSSRIPPRGRPGTYASATAGVRFLGIADLGPHSYLYSRAEKNGIVYTCRGGHVDVAHVRKAADWTGYLAAVVLEHLEKGDTEFAFKLWEPSRYYVSITLPPDWSDLSPQARETQARAAAVELGQYLAFTAMTWHEILTWFGYRPKGYRTEFPSAFSWEDTYSNLLGTRVAASALHNAECDFNDAVTAALERELSTLDPQPGERARQLTQQLRGRWFRKKRFIFTDIRKRNLDLGLDDGLVTPVLIPEASGCEGADARPLPVPTLARLADLGFSAEVGIEPREWERDRIWAAVNMDGRKHGQRLDPAADFPQIMAYIADEALCRYALSI
jgi:hypothetical protein